MAAPLALDIRFAHLQEFEDHARKMVPSFRVRRDKRSSYLMNVVDGYLYLFNKKFMNYITTVGSTVYMDEEHLKNYPDAALEILAHEFVHAYDSKRLRHLLFGFLYLFPLSLVPIALVLYGLVAGSMAVLLPVAGALVHLLAVGISSKARKVTGFPLMAVALVAMGITSGIQDGLSALFLLAALVPALPLPAPGRYWAELRGYGMSLHVEQWLYGNSDVRSKVRQFTGWSYYLMWPLRNSVHARLRSYADQAKRADGRENDEVLPDPAFRHVAAFFADLRRNT